MDAAPAMFGGRRSPAFPSGASPLRSRSAAPCGIPRSGRRWRLSPRSATSKQTRPARAASRALECRQPPLAPLLAACRGTERGFWMFVSLSRSHTQPSRLFHTQTTDCTVGSRPKKLLPTLKQLQDGRADRGDGTRHGRSSVTSPSRAHRGRGERRCSALPLRRLVPPARPVSSSVPVGEGWRQPAVLPWTERVGLAQSAVLPCSSREEGEAVEGLRGLFQTIELGVRSLRLLDCVAVVDSGRELSFAFS